MKFDNAPRLSKLPFILGDIALLALASFIAARHSDPISALPLFFITFCVVAGIVALMIPFLVNYARDQEDTASALRHELGEQFKRLIAASEHLQNSTIQLKSIEEVATKNVQAAESLPYRLQERIAEFNQQLLAAENKDKARLEQELARLRSAESERLAAAAAENAKSLASWADVVTDLRQELAAAARLQEKFTAALPALEGAIAGLQAAVDAAAKAVDAIPSALPPPAIVSPPASPIEEKPIETAVAAPSPIVDEPATQPAPIAMPQPDSAPEVAPTPEPPATIQTLESNGSVPPIAGADGSGSPAPAEATSIPTAVEKPRKPRAPRKPRTGSTPPVDSTGETAGGSAPPVEIPADRPPPVELIAEPVADEPPPPESFSQLPPEENKPAATPSADGRTRLTVVSYIGIGNKLHLRGEGGGLSLTKGVSLQFVSIGRWRWETDSATGPVTCRIYKNDKLEAPVGPLTLEPGTEQEIAVTF